MTTTSKLVGQSSCRRIVIQSVKITPWLAVAFALIWGVAGCGKDQPDFDDLKGEVGAVPGNFNARLAANYREQVDSLQDKLESAIPGVGAKLDQRFGKDDGDAGDGTKLSDLLKVKLPGTDSDAINSRLMEELTKLEGDKGTFFDAVDTEKYLKTPVYESSAATGDFDEHQYYLDMIRWHEAVKDLKPVTMADSVPIVVAVLDTGVLATHEDLKNVMWQNTSADVGYDASTGKPISKSGASDSVGHGTHVAGTIAAQGDNGVGINGVGYVTGLGGVTGKSIIEIMDIKVLNDNGSGTSEMLSDGLKWAVEQFRAQKTGDRAKQKMIVNMSLGGPFETKGYTYKKNSDGTYDFQDDIINYATKNGDVLVVVAAGNESCGIGGPCDLPGESYQETYYYPCSYANVLCVAATSAKDTLAGFSNRLGSVGIAAPGFDIVSTLPDSTSSYGYMSGTSMATPVTAGAAAVLWSMYPDFTATEIKLILQKSSAQIADITGVLKSGAGRLDLKAAMDFAKQIKAAGSAVATAVPASGLVQTAKITPPAASVPSGGDPDESAENSGHKTADKGNGSANGCAVIATSKKPLNTTNAFMLIAFGLGAPLLMRRRVVPPN